MNHPDLPRGEFDELRYEDLIADYEGDLEAVKHDSFYPCACCGRYFHWIDSDPVEIEDGDETIYVVAEHERRFYCGGYERPMTESEMRRHYGTWSV
jgi:hypothetical protein